MTDPEAAKAMEAVAAATRGPDTPNAAAVVAKPDRGAVRMLLGSGPAISLMLIGLVGLVVFVLWPDAVRLSAFGVMTDIVRVLGGVAFALCATLGVITFRLASGGLKRVEAKAGPAGLTVETGD